MKEVDTMDDQSDLSNELLSEDAVEEMEAFSQFFGTPGEVMARYSHCALCGANLHFTHMTDFSKNLTQETARCPECGVRVRKLMHRLQ